MAEKLMIVEHKSSKKEKEILSIIEKKYSDEKRKHVKQNEETCLNIEDANSITPMIHKESKK